jgi:two-component system OmpR family response regulator
MKIMKLLIVEDNVALAWRLQKALNKPFDVHLARTGSEGQRLAASGRYDAIILDLGLPDISGDEVCTALRAGGITSPILVLTAEGALHSKVRMFKIGADDYLTKPFEMIELQARLQALVRRRQVGLPHLVLKIDDLTINLSKRIVERNGIPILLRRKEFDILEYLARNRGKIVTQTMILNHVWGELDHTAWSNSVRVHIKHLRDKIDRPFAIPLIKTERGVGYILEDL